jgi:sugar fermentation stimulation protein A
VRFQPPLEEATLLRRYKRFLADVRFAGGRTVTAHCTNTGRMTGCAEPGSAVLLAHSDSPTRKLAWTLRLVKVGRSWVSVDTLLPNRVVADALRRGRVPGLAMYDEVATEVPYGEGGRSRIDVLLTDSTGRHPQCFVEVKNVTMKSGNHAIFPDAVSARGLKHLRELEREVARGHRAVLLPFVARGDCRAFDAAREVDPSWADALDTAAEAGVEVLPWRARVGRASILLDRPIPWRPRPSFAPGV